MAERDTINKQILFHLLEARELAGHNPESPITHLIDVAIFACRQPNDAMRVKAGVSTHSPRFDGKTGVNRETIDH
jgi:hypothetical protein